MQKTQFHLPFSTPVTSADCKAQMSAQTDLFDKFCEDSRRLQEVQLSIPDAPELNKSEDDTGSELEDLERELHALQQPTTGSLFDITVEITKLREIMDIEDELHMIEDILHQQTKAVLMLDDVLHFKRDNPAPDLLNKIEYRRGAIQNLQADAQRPYEGVSVMKTLL